MPSARCTRSLAWEKINHTSVVTTGPPESPDIPARNGFNGLFSCSPRRSGFLVTVISRVFSQDLTPASTRQDHTTLPSPSCALPTSPAHAHPPPPPLHPLPHPPPRGTP